MRAAAINILMKIVRINLNKYLVYKSLYHQILPTEAPLVKITSVMDENYIFSMSLAIH